MGQAYNFPSAYLTRLISSRLEISVLLGLVVVGALLAIPAIRNYFAKSQTGFLFDSGSTKILFQKILGLFWFLDGLLQAQPSMPREFIPMVVEPAMSGQPQWLEKLGNLGINMWTLHTVSTDATTVIIQVLIGVMLIVGNETAIAKIGLNLSIVWGLIIWAIAEGMGSIFVTGASILSGAPGAVLLYVIAAVLLLRMDKNKFDSGAAGKVLWNITGGVFLLGALVQLLPAEGFFRGSNLSALFQNAASNPQPILLKGPIDWLASISASYPMALNLIISGLIVVTALGILSNRNRRFWLYFVSSVLVLVWWFGMDFGAVGGVGTDFNLAPVLFVYLLVGYRSIVFGISQVDHSITESVLHESREDLKTSKLGETQKSLSKTLNNIPGISFNKLVSIWLVISLAVATIWIVMPDVGSFSQAVSTPQVETAALVDSGGLAQVPGNPLAPNFTLLNQYGTKTSLSSFRGKVVILSFLDPVCYETCPVVAEEFVQTAKLLQKKMSKLEFVAVNANPYFTNLSSVNAFDGEHGLTNVPNWEFLTGSAEQLQKVWAQYGAVTEVPQVGMIAHSLLVYMITASGREAVLTQATGRPGLNLELSYAQMFANEAGRLVGRG